METEPWTPGFNHTGFDDPITEFAVMLLGRRYDQLAPFGSGIIIGPHMALTARHVLDEFFQKYEGVELSEQASEPEANFAVQAVQFLDNGTRASAWDVRQIFASDRNDIAFLLLAPATKEQLRYEWHSPMMQLLPPPVGSLISHSGIILIR